jgi:hypothetical protein
MDHHHPGDAMDNAMKGQPDGGDRDTGEPRQWLPTGGGDGTYPAHTYFQGPYGAQGPAPPGAVPAYGGMPPYGLMYAPYGGGHMYPAPGGGYGPPSGAMGKSDDGGMMIGGDFYGRRKTGPKAWSKHEDELLLSIVQSMSWPMKWTVVAQRLPGRTGKQCRERYVNHLNPRLKVSDWNLVEDATIFHLYNSIGSHWAKMSKVIPGRTDNGIKNRFHNIRRQYEREDEHRQRLNSNADYPEEIRLDRLRDFPEHLKGNSAGLWDMQDAIGLLAAQTLVGGGTVTVQQQQQQQQNRSNSNRFGPFRDTTAPGPDGAEDLVVCTRCGFTLPSLQTGIEVCTKTGWCRPCTIVPPHASGNFLRDCLNLRRCPDKKLRAVIESWEELFAAGLTSRRTPKKAAPKLVKQEEPDEDEVAGTSGENDDE